MESLGNSGAPDRVLKNSSGLFSFFAVEEGLTKADSTLRVQVPKYEVYAPDQNYGPYYGKHLYSIFGCFGPMG